MSAPPTVNVIEPADSYALISLPALKVMLGIAADDVSDDAQLKMIIDQNSAVMANLCERIFAREKVEETWYGVDVNPNSSRRLYLTHAPVRSADIISVESPPGTIIDPASYKLDERTGKLIIYSTGTDDIVITYTGGFVLPSEAPLDLQQCAGLLVRQFRTEAAQAGTVGSGIRMIAHKDSRVMYHSPKDMSASSSASASGSVTASATDRALKDLLQRYKRMWA
jgi:hypothetical protein